MKKKKEKKVITQKMTAFVKKQRRAQEFENFYSYSKMTSFMSCPHMYRETYVLKKNIKPSLPMIRGRKLHEVAEKLVSIDSPEKTRELMKGQLEVDIQHGIKYAEFYSNKFL